MDIIEEIKKQLKARYSGSTYNHAERCYKQGIAKIGNIYQNINLIEGEQEC